jgi:biotin transport system substrate-specific component
MNNNISGRLKLIVFSSLFTALIIVGAYIAIPMIPVPVVLANFFVFLASLLLGPAWGTVSVLIYLLLGFAGLPVFSSGTAGFLHLVGPTGGYLFGYIPAVLLGGLIAGKEKQSVARDCCALLVSAIAIYAVGVPWLKFQAKLGWDKAFLAGMLPFLIGDAIKIAAAVILAGFLRPLVREYVRPKKTDAQDS